MDGTGDEHEVASHMNVRSSMVVQHQSWPLINKRPTPRELRHHRRSPSCVPRGTDISSSCGSQFHSPRTSSTWSSSPSSRARWMWRLYVSCSRRYRLSTAAPVPSSCCGQWRWWWWVWRARGRLLRRSRHRPQLDDHQHQEPKLPNGAHRDIEPLTHRVPTGSPRARRAGRPCGSRCRSPPTRGRAARWRGCRSS